jgi:anti-sigma B factor antagonist
MALELEINTNNDACHIKAIGEIDLYTSPDLRAALTKAIDAHSAGVGVDLSEVGYMDSSGVATFVEGLRMVGKKTAALVLVAPSEPVLKVFQLSRLDTVFDIRNSWEA